MLTKNAQAMADSLLKGALLLISGFLCDDETIILHCFSNAGFIKKSTSEKDGWIAMMFCKQ